MTLFYSPSSFGREDPPSPWKSFTEAKDHIDQNVVINVKRVQLKNELMNEKYLKVMNVAGQIYWKHEKKDYLLWVVKILHQ